MTMAIGGYRQSAHLAKRLQCCALFLGLSLLSSPLCHASPRLGPSDIPEDAISIPLSIETIDEDRIHREIDRWSRSLCRAMLIERRDRCRPTSLASAIVETHVVGSTDRTLVVVHLSERRVREAFRIDRSVPIAIFRFRLCRASSVALEGERISQSTVTVGGSAGCFDPLTYLEQVAARLEPNDRPQAITLAKIELIRRVIQAEENDSGEDDPETRSPSQAALPGAEDVLADPPPPQRSMTPTRRRSVDREDAFVPRSMTD